jgi:hypothetical protein
MKMILPLVGTDYPWSHKFLNYFAAQNQSLKSSNNLLENMT